MTEEEITAQLLQNPEMLQRLVDSGLAPERMGIVQAQQKRLEPWMDAQQPQGQSVGPYHAYVAASPLEHLAAAFRQGAGINQIGQGNQVLGQLIGQQGVGRGDWMRAIAQLAQQQPQQTVPGGMMGDLDPNT